MFSLRTLVVIIGLLNLSALLVFLVSSGSKTYAKSQELHTEHLKHYSFNEPVLAFNILRKLDRYKKLPPEAFNTNKPAHSFYDEYYLGLKKDEGYCQKVRGYFVDHPEVYFNEKNFLTDYLPQSLTRNTIIPEVGLDTMPKISYYMPKKEREGPTYDIKPNINAFFTNVALHNFYEVGRNFLCLPQIYNHVPGIGTLARKDLMARSVANYKQKYRGRPTCFDSKKVFPETFLLEEESDCRKFFQYIDTNRYKAEKAEKGIVFIRKTGIGAHKGEGVQIVNDQEEQQLRTLYEDGHRCGEVKKSLLIQKYIHNPLLADGHKFDLRAYLLIASTNPVIAYYHDGFLRVSLYDYESKTPPTLDSTKQNGNESQPKNYEEWSLERFNRYLLDSGKTANNQWLETYLRPALQEALVHIVRMTQDSYYKHSGAFELLGIDFLLDDDLNIWFIEGNTSPVIKATNAEKERLVKKMLKDMFAVVYSYLKSRIKRVIDYVNWLSLDQVVESKYLDGVIIPNVEDRHKEFEDLLKNKLEKQFKVNKENGWMRIVDDNLSSRDRYSKILEEDCFD